jgi:protein gp37
VADNSKIEWTQSTWNPVTGCTKVSPGCDHCYAERIVERFKGKGAFEQVTLNEDRLAAPLHWRKPRRVFVNSMSDLFHDAVPDDYIARVFAVMAATPQHTYQLLTKRHGRMRSLLRGDVYDLMVRELTTVDGPPAGLRWPLPNVWLGVSVEDQKRADLRIPALLNTPAAVRFLSCEPLLGPINLQEVARADSPDGGWSAVASLGHGEQPRIGVGIDWVIVGGESGSGARPMHPDWARALRDQCTAADVPFFFKQWGEWAPNGSWGIGNINPRERLVGEPNAFRHREVIERMGKHRAGRELDGRTWDEYPQEVLRAG